MLSFWLEPTCIKNTQNNITTKNEQKDHNNTMNNIWNVMWGLVGSYSNSTCTYKVQIQYDYVVVYALVGEISQIMPQINKNYESYMISANIHYGIERIKTNVV